MQVSAFSFLSPYVSTTVKSGVFLFYWENAFFPLSHDSKTSERFSLQAEEKEGGENFTFWQRYRWKFLTQKRIFQNKIKEACENKGL